jgi:hypothetical protein
MDDAESSVIQFNPHQFPTELWQRIFGHLDPWDKFRLAKTCRFLNEQAFESSTRTLVVTVRLPPQSIRRLYFSQKYHMLTDDEVLKNERNTFFSSTDQRAIDSIIRFESVSRLFAFPPDLHPFKFVRIVHIHFSKKVNMNSVVQVQQFTELHTLKLYYRITFVQLIKRDEEIRLPRMRHLHLDGFAFERPFTLCPNLRTLHCEPLQWKLVVESLANDAQSPVYKLEKVHIFCKRTSDLAILDDCITVDTGLSVQRMTISYQCDLQVDSIAIPNHYSVLKLNFATQHISDSAQTVIDEALAYIESHFDLTAVQVHVNGMRLTSPINRMQIFHYLTYWICSRDAVREFDFNRRYSDKLRSRLLNSEYVQFDFRRSMSNRFDYGFLASMSLHDYRPQEWLDTIPDFFPLLLDLKLFLTRHHVMMPTYDLCFLCKLINLQTLHLFAFNLRDFSVLLQAIRQLPLLKSVYCFLPLSLDQTRQMIRAVNTKISRKEFSGRFILCFREQNYLYPAHERCANLSIAFSNPNHYIWE